MGCTTSNGPSATPESLKIEAELKEEKKALNRTFKVLLLGAGDSGKSTFLKQICLVHKRAFPDYDVKRQSTEIRQYLVTSAKNLAGQAQRASIKKENLGHLDFLISGEEQNLLDRRYVTGILALVNDHGFSDLYQTESRISLNLDTNLSYFFQEKTVERIFQDGYLPIIEDMLAFRVKTTGVRQEQFINEAEKTTIQIIDVGGQKSEKKKWMNQFDSVDLVIYFSSLDGYSLELHECDGNRLEDDLQLFRTLMGEVPQKKFWLFMQTKYDVLEKTLQVCPITKMYPEVPAEKAKDAGYVAKFLQEKFNDIFDGQKIVFFTANMLVTDQLGVVWDTIRKDLMAGLLKAYV